MRQLFVVCCAATALSACGQARFVTVEPKSAVVAMPNNADYHRERAVQLMAQKCPGGYEIDREGEVVVGSETSHNGSRASSVSVGGIQVGGGAGTTTVNATEWRIEFHCR